MITYFQQHKTNAHSFCECDKAKASHFKEDDGKMQPLNKLTNNHLTTNVPVGSNEEETCEMPTMNFDGEDDNQIIKNETGEESLPATPTLNFDAEEKARIAEKNKAIGKDVQTNAAVYNDEEGVPATPSMY